MKRIFNRISMKEKRRDLRKNMTKAEVLLWIELRKRKVCSKRFLRQFSIGHYIVDFYSPSLRLAIEVDGATHIEDGEILYDKKRQNEIERLGINFLRFRNDEIYYEMESVIRKIRKKIRKLEREEPPFFPPSEKGG